MNVEKATFMSNPERTFWNLTPQLDTVVIEVSSVKGLSLRDNPLRLYRAKQLPLTYGDTGFYIGLALYPGSQWAGKERAWYPLFAHVLNLPEILVNQKLLCYIRIIMTTNVYLPLHCPHTFWPTMEAFRSFILLRSPAPSSSLWRLGTSDMSLKKVQVANRFGFCFEKFGYCLVSSPDPSHHTPSENWRGKNGRRVW